MYVFMYSALRWLSGSYEVGNGFALWPVLTKDHH